jgi:hypothetical protein
MVAVVPNEIRALSDEELIALVDTLNGGVGCLVWLLVPAVTLSTGVLYGAPIALLSSVAAAFACRFIDQLRERTPSVRRARLAEHEFYLRYGVASFERVAAEARERLASARAVIVLEAVGLPHGRHDTILVELGEEARIALHSTPQLADLLADFAAKRAQIARLDQPLAEAAAAQLEALILQLTAADDGELSEVMAVGVDGVPSKLLVLRRGEPEFEARLDMLSDQPAETSSGAFRLAKRLLELQAELVRPRVRSGQ